MRDDHQNKSTDIQHMFNYNIEVNQSNLRFLILFPIENTRVLLL
jgi:hypothetical protein